MAWWPDGGFFMMMMMTIISFVQAEDSNRFFDLRVTYGNVSVTKYVPPTRVHFQQYGYFCFRSIYMCVCIYLFLNECKIYLFKIHMHSDMQVILINGKFPGPELYLVTNDNLIINVHNDLDEPFLLSWYLFIYLFRFTFR